jgi:hypothetical protein
LCKAASGREDLKHVWITNAVSLLAALALKPGSKWIQSADETSTVIILFQTVWLQVDAPNPPARDGKLAAQCDYVTRVQ